jgi:Replication protein C C-terminal region
VLKSLWGDACLAMGRELAAVALAIVSAKEADHFQISPGGYFRGMVAKAKAGELHLERTVWPLAAHRGAGISPRGGEGTASAVTEAGHDRCKLQRPRTGESSMRFGDPELTLTPCPACGCAEVFTAEAPPGELEMPLYPAWCRCRCRYERDDVADFYVNPPIQPRRFAGSFQ